MQDKLDEIFELRRRFIREIDGEEGVGPLDLSTKAVQRHLRDLSLNGVEEIFEGVRHFKNWKPHRKTEIASFDKDEFLEEWVDAFNFFLSVMVKSGVTAEEFYSAFRRKDEIIHERLRNGY